jgi:hypothetical protein
MRAKKTRPLTLLRTIECAMHTENECESYSQSRFSRKFPEGAGVFIQEA